MNGASKSTNSKDSSFKYHPLLGGLLTVTVLPVLVIGLFELLVFVSLSLFVFVTGVWFAVFVDVIVGLFVFVVVVVTSDVAAANVKWFT